MTKPTDQEQDALAQAEILLRFAAENKQLTESIASAISHARDAVTEDKWNPDEAAKFWVAYNSLCTLLKPVTWDTLLNNEVTATSKGLLRHRPGPLSKRLARRYLGVLIVGLVTAIILQFAVATATNLATDIKRMIGELALSKTAVIEQMAPVRRALGTGSFLEANLKPEDQRAIAIAQSQFRSIWLKEDAIAKKIQLLGLLTTVGALDTSWNTGSYQAISSGEQYDTAVLEFYRNQQYFASIEEASSVTTSIINSVLPFLLGFVGACAYVTRLISEQIKDSTFSSTSSVRHLVRVALGALAGAIVGFGWIGTGISASPLAVAFIAGYAIEPVFATFDSIAEKFR